MYVFRPSALTCEERVDGHLNFLIMPIFKEIEMFFVMLCDQDEINGTVGLTFRRTLNFFVSCVEDSCKL